MFLFKKVGSGSKEESRINIRNLSLIAIYFGMIRFSYIFNKSISNKS